MKILFLARLATSFEAVRKETWPPSYHAACFWVREFVGWFPNGEIWNMKLECKRTTWLDWIVLQGYIKITLGNFAIFRSRTYHWDPKINSTRDIAREKISHIVGISTEDCENESGSTQRRRISNVSRLKVLGRDRILSHKTYMLRLSGKGLPGCSY